MDAERFTQHHPLFFLDPSAAPSAEGFEGYALPDGWHREQTPSWTYCFPSNGDMPEQGWKVHVSTTMDGAEACLAVVAGVCSEAGVPFKHLPTVTDLFERNSKLTEREHAGKFVTCYPEANGVRHLLDELERGLAGHQGPYVLSDLRWSSAPVYLRFGAFVEMSTEDEDGTSVSAMRSPDGTLVPDRRRPYFDCPEWASVPPGLERWWAAHHEEKVEQALLPFDVEHALIFTNGGGGLTVVWRTTR